MYRHQYIILAAKAQISDLKVNGLKKDTEL